MTAVLRIVPNTKHIYVCVSYVLLCNKLPKLSGLQNTYVLSYSLCGSAVWPWFLCSGFHKAAIKVSVGLNSLQEAQLGKNSLLSSLDCWQNLFPSGLWEPKASLL